MVPVFRLPGIAAPNKAEKGLAGGQSGSRDLNAAAAPAVLPAWDALLAPVRKHPRVTCNLQKEGSSMPQCSQP